MFEAQKLEGLRPSQSMSQTCHSCESSKEYVPSLFFGQLQSEIREPLPHLLLELVHILSELETHDEIISETHEVRLASTLWFDLLFKPQIENKVEVKVAQHG
jgi:Mg2+ and Co2+ transporter CorA